MPYQINMMNSFVVMCLVGVSHALDFKGAHWSTEKITYVDAKADCISRGMDLPSILNAEDQRALVKVATERSGRQFWLSATKQKHNVWQWSSGQTLTKATKNWIGYQNWYKKQPDKKTKTQPDNYGGNQNCMSIDINEGYDGTWWDDLCSRKYIRYYVCVVSEESRKAQEATRKKKEAKAEREAVRIPKAKAEQEVKEARKKAVQGRGRGSARGGRATKFQKKLMSRLRNIEDDVGSLKKGLRNIEDDVGSLKKLLREILDKLDNDGDGADADDKEY